MQELLRTPLYDWHVAHSARMLEFGGWEMPIQYSSVIQEHDATRNRVGVTDVSHMGRLVFSGPGACSFLDSVLTRNIAALQPGQIRYSLLTNTEGQILDDLLVGLQQNTETGELYYNVVVNASNREKDVAFIQRFLTPDVGSDSRTEVQFRDETFEKGMIAVQGPRSVELLQPLVQTDLRAMKYYSGCETTVFNGSRWAFVSRTGYTGEDGFEIVLESFLVEQFMDELFETGKTLDVVPVGLGARDTLRLEAGMPLYGHELDENTTPFEAGLSYALYLDGPDFPGRDVFRSLASQTPAKVRVGLEMKEKRPAREGCVILYEGEPIGSITSGSFSPTLGKPIAMGYVPPGFSEPGQSLSVDVRGKIGEAIVVPLPFYKRSK